MAAIHPLDTEIPDAKAAKPSFVQECVAWYNSLPPMKQLWCSFQGLVTSAINSRFLMFKHHFILALLVLSFTLSAVSGITYYLLHQCDELCASAPISAAEGLRPGAKCKGGTYYAGLSTGLQDGNVIWNAVPSTETFGRDYTFGNNNAPPLHVILNGTKCSSLHASNCGLLEWANLLQGIKAIKGALDPLTEDPMPFPTASNTGSLTAGGDAIYGCAASNDPRNAREAFSEQDPAYRVSRALSGVSLGCQSNTGRESGNWSTCRSATDQSICDARANFQTGPLQDILLPIWQSFPDRINMEFNTSEIVLFKAPEGAACCDIIYSTETSAKLEDFPDPPFATLKIRSSNIDSIEMPKPGTCPDSARCSWVELTVYAFPTTMYGAQWKSWQFCNGSSGNDYFNTQSYMEQNMKVDVCQYVPGDGSSDAVKYSKLCLSTYSGALLTGWMSDDKTAQSFCSLVPCLLDYNISVVQGDNTWSAVYTPPSPYPPVMDPADMQQLCSKCSMLCNADGVFENGKTFPGSPEWQYKGYLLDTMNVTGRLPANSLMNPWDGMFAWDLAFAKNSFNTSSPYVSGPVTAAWLTLQYMLPAAHDSGLVMASMMAAISPETGSDELSDMLNEKLVYCCYPSCPSFVSALGNALGYAAYIEMLIAFTFVGIYIIVFRSEARSNGASQGFFARLGWVWSVVNADKAKEDKDVSALAFATNSEHKQHEEGIKGNEP